MRRIIEQLALAVDRRVSLGNPAAPQDRKAGLLGGVRRNLRRDGGIEPTTPWPQDGAVCVFAGRRRHRYDQSVAHARLARPTADR